MNMLQSPDSVVYAVVAAIWANTAALFFVAYQIARYRQEASSTRKRKLPE